MASAWAAHPDDVWLADHAQPLPPPAPGTSPSDQHSLVGEEPLQPIPRRPSYTQGYAAEGMASDVGGYGGHACNSGDSGCIVNECEYGCSNGGCCQDDCGGPGLLNCCQVCSPCGFNVEIGFYFLKPRWQSNQAFSVQTGPAPFATANVDFGYNYDISPYLALGYSLDSGLGFRVRYWDFQDNSTVNLANDANQTALAAAPLGLGGTVGRQHYRHGGQQPAA